MKKKIVLIQVLYYILFLLCYIGFALIAVKLLKTDNLAAAVVRAAALMFIMTPAVIAIFTRFSFLRCVIDPIAAAIVPMFFYIGMIVNQNRQLHALRQAFLMVNRDLADDGGMGWIFLKALFVFGLLTSISPARKAGRSISYRIIHKIHAR